MVIKDVEEDVIGVAIPINEAGLVRMRDLRDLMEVLDDRPEEDYLLVLSDEIRYEVGIVAADHLGTAP